MKSTRCPAYVVVEGPDGAGKSTLVAGLARAIRGAFGEAVWETREPGGNPLGERLRACLKDVELQRSTPWLSRRLLFEADRVAQQALVRRRLGQGIHVVQDRCAAVSNHCYGAVEGADDGTVEAIEALDRDRLQPHLVLLIDTPGDLLRLKGGAGAQDPAERDPDLLARVRAEYAELVRQALVGQGIVTRSGFALPAVVVDGALSPEDLVTDAFVACTSFLDYGEPGP